MAALGLLVAVAASVSGFLLADISLVLAGTVLGLAAGARLRGSGRPAG